MFMGASNQHYARLNHALWELKIAKTKKAPSFRAGLLAARHLRHGFGLLSFGGGRSAQMSRVRHTVFSFGFSFGWT